MGPRWSRKTHTLEHPPPFLQPQRFGEGDQLLLDVWEGICMAGAGKKGGERVREGKQAPAIAEAG